MTVETEPSSFDAHLEAVGHPRRRRVLFALLRADDSRQDVSVLELDCDASDREMRLSMQHVHLPKLAELGIIEFDDDLTVRRGPTFDRIEPLVRLLDEHRDRLAGDLV